jgi:predicted nucleotidyltransferase
MNAHLQNDLELIKESVLKTVPTEAIYLFGSYAYGTPDDGSDLDIYVVVPDSVQQNPLDISADIMTSLYKKIKTPLDLLVGKSSVFNSRKEAPTLQRTIVRNGRQIYGVQPRYPDEIYIDEGMTQTALAYAEKIKSFPPLAAVRHTLEQAVKATD